MNLISANKSVRITAYTMLLLALVVCMDIATISIIFSSIPPIFNQEMAKYRLLNIGLALLLSAIALVLSANLIKGYFQAITSCITLVLTWLLVIEFSLFAFDNLVISVKGSPLKSAFYNEKVNGEDIMLGQPNALSPFGFRVEHEETPDTDDYRILFLGNSYVRGSGSDFDSNYPQVVEKKLQQLMPGKKITIMSAGIDGYGIKDDRLIFDYLLDKGYKIDAVVINFMMESDLANNIPGTFRMAVAGEPQRFHENAFLRYFYPLNSYLFRYSLYFKVAFEHPQGEIGSKEIKDATCDTSDSFTAFIRERTRYYYGANAKQRVYVDYNTSQAMDIIETAKEKHIKPFIVLLPDPGAALDKYRALSKGMDMDWDWPRKAVTEKLASGAPVYDLAPSFRNKPNLFRCDDSHWLDSGNVVGGDLVASWLASQLRMKNP